MTTATPEPGPDQTPQPAPASEPVAYPCPHCSVTTAIAKPHCPPEVSHTCTWLTCGRCGALIDPSGRHTHPKHAATYQAGQTCYRLPSPDGDQPK